MVEPGATADVARSTADLLRIVARSPGQQELILTRAGRFVETPDSGQLAKLAMLREVELAQERVARSTHIDDAGRQFQQDITALTAALSDMARKVEAVAGSLSERARQTGRDAVTVAGATAQTLAGLQDLGDRGHALAATMTKIVDDGSRARAVRGEAHGKIRQASEREIGRASCRERVWQYVSISVVGVSLKKQKQRSQTRQCRKK